MGTRHHQVHHIGHVIGAVAVDFVPPVQAWTDGVVVIWMRKVLRVVEYPHAYMAIGDAGCASKDGPVGQLPHIVGLKLAGTPLPTYGMPFITGLAVQGRFCRRLRPIGIDLIIGADIPSAMAALIHVEVKPGLIMEVL